VQKKIAGLETLLEACALARAFTQEVQAGTADFVVAFNHHFRDAGGIEEIGALNADTIAGDTADSESAIVGITAHIEHHTLEFLDAFAIAFFNDIVYADGISGEQIRDIGVLLGFDRFQ
jgi:hypothetical protein